MSENPPPPVTDLLFVYGTLRQSNQNEYATHLHRHSTHVGTGWLPGRLYRVDWFPGAVHDETAPTRVWGDVYQLHQPADTLAYLDEYEGVDDDPPPFVRQPVAVQLANRLHRCQVYLYALPTDGLTLIESGIF